MLINCPKDFSCAAYEIILAAGPQGLVLPPYKGSTLRGSFAQVFKQLVCAKRKEVCKNCLLKENCPYHFVFETSPPPKTEALRNYSDIPRPFVLEPPLEQKTDYLPGEILCFHLFLFGRVKNLLPYFIVTLEELGRQGMGKGRRPFSVKEIATVTLKGQPEREIIYYGQDKTVRAKENIITAQEIWRAAAKQPFRDQAMVKFLTPTRLIYQEKLVHEPQLHILIRHLLRKVSSLYYFYHGQPWQEDFVSIIKRAEEVVLIENNTVWSDWERYSSRHQIKMKLGGLIGETVYKGPVNDFWPLLKLGELVHVGKGGVFGLGKYQVSGL